MSAVVPLPAPRQRRPAGPINTRATFRMRFSTMAVVGLRMMFHDKLKMFGTLAGVIFATVLSNQQAGTFLGLIYKNVMFVENAGADVWIVPANTETIQAGKLVSDSNLMAAKVTPGVAEAAPILFGNAVMSLPGGGSQPVTLVGAKAPWVLGGPWNIVQGERELLGRPDTMFFEDSDREYLGNLNLRSVRELNGHNVVAGGFTWGLLPFGPSYAFADFDLARSLLRVDNDQLHFVLVKVAPGADPKDVRSRLQAALTDVKVMTRAEYKSSIVRYVLTKTPIGITFGTSTLFGLVVGLVIVSLSMFSAVVDNVREFGTLKAIGATNTDLAKLLFVQSVTYAVMGTLVGLFLVTRLAEGIRSAKLALQLIPELFIGTSVLMIGLCVFASTLALLRLRKVEPAMVFR
ncbi:MAG: FtsX-like permease family protein [Deltaproteobacteria bacterium]|nr:FtsX-like permease family protein [Deltaproteobacteria bacterium]